MGVRHAAVSRPIARRKDRENPEPRTVKQTEFPEGMTIEQTTDWVSSDKERAQAALDHERAQPTPRTSLITSLEKITSESTGAGIASGEA